MLKYFLVPEITYWYTCKLFKWFPELLPLVSSFFLFFRFKHFIQLSFPPEPRLAFIWILCVHISWWNTNKILCKFLTKISLPLYVNFKVLSPSTTICVYCIKDSVFVSVFVCVCLCTKTDLFPHTPKCPPSRCPRNVLEFQERHAWRDVWNTSGVSSVSPPQTVPSPQSTVNRYIKHFLKKDSFFQYH